MGELTEEEINEIKSIACSYFHDCRFTEDSSTLETVGKGEIYHKKDQILPYLQTMLFEEHLVEVQIDQTTRIFFTNVVDALPELVEEEQGEEMVIVEPEYEAGSYLKALDHFLLTPLTPGIGNGRIRNSKQLIARFFSGTIAIELGCTFRDQSNVRGVPVLRLNFPVIGRANRNYRAFRVKAVPTIDAKVCVRSPNEAGITEYLYQIVDVSAEGLAFQMPADHPPFQSGELISFSMRVAGIADLEVCGNVRHITKARQKGGIKVICGVQFDLETRSLAADLEKLAAAIQRLSLRDIAEKTANIDGISFIR